MITYNFVLANGFINLLNLCSKFALKLSRLIQEIFVILIYVKCNEIAINNAIDLRTKTIQITQKRKHFTSFHF